jgi:hypothetical protein
LGIGYGAAIFGKVYVFGCKETTWCTFQLCLLETKSSTEIEVSHVFMKRSNSYKRNEVVFRNANPNSFVLVIFRGGGHIGQDVGQCCLKRKRRLLQSDIVTYEVVSMELVSSFSWKSRLRISAEPCRHGVAYLQSEYCFCCCNGLEFLWLCTFCGGRIFNPVSKKG